jgi:general secretion pathway protein L
MKISKINYKEALATLRKQLVSSRFLRWWLGEVSSMAPVWMRSTDLNAASFRFVPLEQVHAPQSQLENDGQRELALTLPSNLVLRKTLTLPLATEENLRQVLEFQMEQHTPFAASQIHFGHRVTARDFEAGQLTVEFAATPRHVVEDAIKTLTGLGSSVRAVFVEDMLSAGLLVNLLPAAVGTKPSILRYGPNPWLAALLVLLALTAMAVPLVIKREAVVQMLPWVEKGKKAAETVDAIRRDLETRVDQHNYLLAKRLATPTVIQTLEELTRVLPDDTWVQSIDIKGNELQLQGETASSVRMISLFEQSSLFRDANFRAPLTKGQASGTERFQLALQIGTKTAPVPSIVAASAASSPISAASAPYLSVSSLTTASSLSPVASVSTLAASTPLPAASVAKKP